MGRTFKIYTKRRLIVSTYFGEHLYGEVIDQWKEIRAHPDFNPSFDLISDLTGVTSYRLSADEVRGLMFRKDPMSEKSIRIMIASTDYVYGNLRMYQMADPSRIVVVVRSWSEANDFLANTNSQAFRKSDGL
jgi:hypothetical protein